MVKIPLYEYSFEYYYDDKQSILKVYFIFGQTHMHCLPLLLNTFKNWHLIDLVEP